MRGCFGDLKLSIFISLSVLFGFFSVAHADDPPAPCSNAPGGLCAGIADTAQCSTSIIIDCTAYPRCRYAGWLPGYLCNNHCHNTYQQGSCSPGSVCLCVDENPCPLCTYTGKNLSVCNDNGCGPADSQPPTVAINSPTSADTFTSLVSPIALTGTASDNTTISKVEWSNNRNNDFIGGSGTASGTSDWTIGFVNLEPGQNVVIVQATDGFGNQGADTLTVTYNPPANQGFPIVSVVENSTAYSVNISDPDALAEVAYAWGEKPSVYFLLPFANEDDLALSATEQERYNYLAANFANDWDRLTQSKLPLKMNFMPPFKASAYSKNENDWHSYITKSIDQFEADNAGILNYPLIYVFLYPEPYFDRTYINMFGSSEKKILAEAYLSLFNDTIMAGYANPNEIISNVIQHEIAHYFAMLPNNNNFPPGDNKYFWIGHPAGFSGVQSDCDEHTSLFDCDPYGAADSPTGTDGYYEAFSILSLARPFITRVNFENRDPELSPLEEMEMGLRSKYDDSHFMYYEGYLSGSADERRFNLIASHDYNISSRKLYDYTMDRDSYHSLYWNISYDATKTILSGSTRSFSVSRSSQESRPLIVYAGDALNPGYFKIFSNNAYSETYSPGIDLVSPSVPANLSVR